MDDAAGPPAPPTSAVPSASASADAGPVRCGAKTCAAGEVCCNASCGICTPPGMMCIQQFCGGPEPVRASPDAGASSTGAVDRSCKTDADCALHYNWCGEPPCACQTHAKTAKAPTCSPPVKAQCFMDPCAKKSAVCRAGTCAIP